MVHRISKLDNDRAWRFGVSQVHTLLQGPSWKQKLGWVLQHDSDS